MKVAKNPPLHAAYYPINSGGATCSFTRNPHYFTFALFFTVLQEKQKLKYILNCILFSASGHLLAKNK